MRNYMKIPYTDLKQRIVKKDEDEPRRHKSHCKFYSNNYCSYYFIKCSGSSHCLKYKEMNNNKNSYNLLIDEMIRLDREKNKCNQVSITKSRNCSIILYIDDFRMKQIEMTIKKHGKYPLLINLRNAESFVPTMNQLNVTQIYLEHNKELIPCYFQRKDVVIINKNDIITIKSYIECFMDENPISKKCKRIWYEKDVLLGNVEILLNPVRRQKNKCK